MSKQIEINGKMYELKEVDEATEETTEEETPAVEETVEETPAEEATDDGASAEEESVEVKLDDVAEKLVAKLGIGDLHKKIADLQNEVKSNSDVLNKKTNPLINLETLMKKEVKEMTSREKILGFFQGIVQSDHAVMKALSEGTAADGGYLFPDEFRSEIIRDIADQPRMRNEVTIIPMRRDVMNIPTLASRPQVTWTDENATKSTTTAHFGQVTLTVKKMAAILYASDELIDDSTEIDIVNFIIGLFAEAIGEEEDRVIWRGNGTTEPTGIVGNIGTTLTSDGNMDVDEFLNLLYELPQRYQANAKFYAHRQLIRDMRKLKDSNNRFYWAEPVAAGLPPTFYGYPVIEVNVIPVSELYFGDLKKTYWLGDRQQMTVKVSQDTETAFTKDQTAIRVVSRIAGNVVLTASCKALTSIA